MTVPSRAEVLHERAADIETLVDALASAETGAGRTVLVEGSPGIGKTRLIDELCRAAGGRTLVLRARGGEQEQGLPLLVVRELFAPLTRPAATESLDRALAGAAALAGPLLGRGSSAESLDPTALVHALYWLVVNLSDEQPVVLVIDDVHWADPSTQRWLAYLLPRLGELPLLLVLAARPRELQPTSPLALGLADARELIVVRPTELSPAAAAGVVRAVLPDADDVFCDAVCRATSGNPLLLGRLALEARNRGLEPTGDGAAVLAELAELGLARIVLPRLHSLGAESVTLARSVALLGDDCSLGDAAAMAGLEPPVATRAHDALVRGDFLRDQARPAFVHPLVRAVVTSELSVAQRAQHQLRAAVVLHDRGAPAEQVARHLAATEPSGLPWVPGLLLRAAAEASARGAPEAALVDLVTVLREDLDATTRCQALLAAGWQAFRCADPRGRQWLEEALALASDRETAVRAWLAYWNWTLIIRDGHDPRSAFAGLPDDLDDDSALTVLGNFTLDLGFTGRGLRDQRHRYPGPREDPPGETLGQRLWLAAQAMDEVLTAGDRTRSLRCAERAYGDGAMLKGAVDLANPAWVALARIAGGEIVEAEQQAVYSEEYARRQGSLLPAEWYRGTIARCQAVRGDLRAAEATLGDWLESHHEPAAPVVRPTYASVIALVHLGRDRLTEAQRTLEDFGYADVDPPGDFHGSFLLETRGRVHLASGRVEAAARDFEVAGRVLDSFGGARCTLVPWRCGLAIATALLGRCDDARRLAEEQLADARRWGAGPLLGRSLATVAEVVGGSEGVEYAQEAVAVLESSEARGDHAAALLSLGRLLRQSRRPSEARPSLEQALDAALQLGANLVVRQAEEELRLSGARPRRRAVSGVDALTPAELRSARLAAQGLSNPEIAQQLFVTRKTVEKHLSSAFGKLQISSRDQLVVVL